MCIRDRRNIGAHVRCHPLHFIAKEIDGFRSHWINADQLFPAVTQCGKVRKPLLIGCIPSNFQRIESVSYTHLKEGHQYGGGQFNNSRNAFPDGKIVRIAAEAAVKNRAIHKKANIDCKQKAQLLLCNRFDVSHANKPWTNR